MESSNESTTSADEESQTENRRSRKRKARKRSEGKDVLSKLLINLKNRKVPEQENFDEKTGQSFDKYLVKFEKFCNCNFKGDSRFWIGELERKLSGKMLEAMKSMRNPRDSYELVKEKLLKWYKDSKYLRKKKYRSDFEKSNYAKRESLYLYSTRLENLYSLAYPKHIIKSSMMLREKFLKTIPNHSKRVIASQIMAYKLAEKR